MSKYGLTTGGVYIHYEPERIEYALSESELTSLCQHTDNVWKDFCIGCTAVGIPCIVNAVIAAKRTIPFVATVDFAVNGIVGTVGIVLGLAFGIAWRRSHKSADHIVQGIKSKPKVRVA